MRKPIIEHVDKWTDHYKSTVEGKIPFEDMYVLNQKGRGLGNRNKSHVIYKIQKGKNPPISAQLVSPVAQGINQAESMMKKKKAAIKRKKTSGRTHSGKITKRKAPKKVKKPRKKKKTTKKKKKDIFG